MFDPSSDLSRDQKRYIAAGAVVFVALAIAAVGVAQFPDQRLDAEVTVVDTSDPTNIHRASQLTVRVHNQESRAIQPEFQTVHGQLMTHFYWNELSGPKTLQPGESAVYRLRAPVSTAAIPYRTRAILAVNDDGVDDQLRKTFTLDAREPPRVLNPSLHHWLVQSGSGQYPYRWARVTTNRPGEETTLEPTGNRSSALLSVSGVDRESGPWSMARIYQRSAFPSTLHVEATPRTVVRNTTGKPPRATGVGVSESDHRVWVVFADVENRTVVHRQGDPSYLYVYVPAEPGERVEATVDVRGLYEAHDWETPSRGEWVVDSVTYEYRPVRTFGFAAVYPGNELQNASVVIHEITAGNTTADTPNNTTTGATASTTADTRHGTTG